MNARLVWPLVAACGVLALGTVRAATPCRFSTAPSGTLAPFWKGRLGKPAIVMFPTIGTRGEPDQRGGGLFWAGPICTRSRRVIGNVLLRLPDQRTSIASGSFLLAPNHHRQVVCDVAELMHAGPSDQVLGNQIAGSCADGQPLALEVKRVRNPCTLNLRACIPPETTDVTGVTTTTLQCVVDGDRDRDPLRSRTSRR